MTTADFAYLNGDSLVCKVIERRIKIMVSSAAVAAAPPSGETVQGQVTFPPIIITM